MGEHPIKGLMSTAMENLKEMIDVNTIIGDPVETPDGSVILTVSKVGFGFAAGGSEFQAEGQKSSKSEENQQQNEPKLPFGGGSGGGVSITPIAFLIVNATGIKMLHLNESAHLYEKILDTAPQAIERIQQMFKKNENTNNQHSTQQSQSTQQHGEGHTGQINL
ncbi:GerW family sporulation protein [Metabacillus iocasae]|uniref:Sporulation protein YtfJ n=1 Tax=Priestia iocasae TaxID=2291674 RepID=A0ABS2QPQ4_9BACI|nr:GerW family sporulation protein [Metabacillus iocasae]MBM7701208.1 sporulation protein YtfJ [Metabacillus iocasae]